jgi:hypothetical protein
VDFVCKNVGCGAESGNLHIALAMYMAGYPRRFVGVTTLSGGYAYAIGRCCHRRRHPVGCLIRSHGLPPCELP